MISTHTLTWSVTSVLEKIRVDLPNFNSHAHVERDLINILKGEILMNFNSHAHVERDTPTLRNVISSI